MSDRSRRRVVAFKPKASTLEQQIRVIAQDDKFVFFGPHARERMEQRGISFLDAIRVLRKGFIDGEIEAGDNPGEWKCKVVANVKGSRDIGVVTIVISEARLFIKTVEWEDL